MSDSDSDDMPSLVDGSGDSSDEDNLTAPNLLRQQQQLQQQQQQQQHFAAQQREAEQRQREEERRRVEARQREEERRREEVRQRDEARQREAARLREQAKHEELRREISAQEQKKREAVEAQLLTAQTQLSELRAAESSRDLDRLAAQREVQQARRDAQQAAEQAQAERDKRTEIQKEMKKVQREKQLKDDEHREFEAKQREAERQERLREEREQKQKQRKEESRRKLREKSATGAKVELLEKEVNDLQEIISGLEKERDDLALDQKQCQEMVQQVIKRGWAGRAWGEVVCGSGGREWGVSRQSPACVCASLLPARDPAQISKPASLRMRGGVHAALTRPTGPADELTRQRHRHRSCRQTVHSTRRSSSTKRPSSRKRRPLPL